MSRPHNPKKYFVKIRFDFSGKLVFEHVFESRENKTNAKFREMKLFPFIEIKHFVHFTDISAKYT